ncbi:sugar phosphate isomerase/epimerase family protein [Paenibacillus thermoaerophilus]|uniref:Sugar phosphate isomerase/epimerase family protein n=1 Tax=Paenibacillus thermoaerophilus TaxID=1215385 RepID=A0ABW2V615_9BACL|nr:sugar phosphate isomerase/epimerase [Paenibacillus thermoaerophilus]TMV07284.1 sugar phosphate isomerase/epimerase [Paenibacillus thermoaerophilus]
MTKVFTTTASLGTLAARRGQEACVPVAKAAGCAGIEIRRELFKENSPDLPALKRRIEDEHLVSAYSAPVELWNSDGSLNAAMLDVVVPEALAVGAVLLKVSLGHYMPGQSDPAELGRYWSRHVPGESALKLTVENDQTPHGGDVRKLQRFFEDCRKAGLPIGMAFDVGNWTWTGWNAAEAAAVLQPYVVYLHLKHVVAVDGKNVTVPLPEEAGSLWRRIVDLLPRDAPRTIEFPVAGDGEELVEALRRYAAMIAKA